MNKKFEKKITTFEILFINKISASSLSILNSGDGHIYTIGTFLTLTCIYLNTTVTTSTSTTPSNPWLMQNHRVPVSPTVLIWKRNRKIFSTRNRKR